MPFGKGLRGIPETPKGIGVEIALWAKNYVRKPKKSSMDGHAEAELCTRELAWLDFATSMDGLAQVHGWTFRSAWFRFCHCMDGVKNAIRTPYFPAKWENPQQPRKKRFPNRTDDMGTEKDYTMAKLRHHRRRPVR